MKFTLYGKIVERTARKVTKADGSTYDLYSMLIEEPGQFPSYFRVGSKDASLFGQKDGPFAVGRMVTASGFANGRQREATGKDGRTFKTESYWFTLTSLTPAEPVAAAPSSAEKPMEDDIPF